MKNLIIRKIDAGRPAKELIEMTAEVLNKGGVVVAPTETKYGLLGCIDRAETVDRLYELKKRPETMATAIFVRSWDDISRFGLETRISKKLASDFLPGPLTLVLKNKSNYQPPIVVDGKIGIRCSSFPFMVKLLATADFNLTATSANLSGGEELDTIDDITGIFGNEIDLYLDAGRLNALPSTVVECIGDDLLILRKGAIAEHTIMESLMGN
jgi:L-threonylcarbamoyladenylate synthase